MMFLKSSSTGKFKSKQTETLRVTEYSTCPRFKANNANRRDYEKPQPIKIAQLLREAESLRKAERDSVRKKILPERLGQSLSVRSAKLNEKQSGKDTGEQSTCFNNRVRRNLNFNDISIDAIKYNNENENKLNQCTVQLIHKEISKPMRKRSSILPPNTIKERHLKKFTRETSKYSKLPQLSKKIMSADKKTDAYTCPKTEKEDKEMKEIDISLNSELPKGNNNFLQSEHMEASNKCEIVTTSNCANVHIDANQPENSDIPHIVMEPTVSSECSTYQNDNYMQTESSPKEISIPNKIESENEICIGIMNDNKVIENLCNDLQDTKLMECESNTNVKCTPSKVICVDEDELIRLERDLRSLLSATEENVLKIKSTLTCVTRLLSMSSNKIVGDEHCSERRVVCKTVADKEIQVEDCKLMQQTVENSETSALHIPQIATDIECDDATKLNKSNESNKENHATINVKHMSDITNSTSQDCYTQQKTPINIKYKQKRSFKEYMALKSTMSFLETPDNKKFKSLRQNENIDPSILNKTYISNKVLTDLHNLYSDSPECN